MTGPTRNESFFFSMPVWQDIASILKAIQIPPLRPLISAKRGLSSKVEQLSYTEKTGARYLQPLPFSNNARCSLSGVLSHRQKTEGQSRGVQLLHRVPHFNATLS